MAKEGRGGLPRALCCFVGWGQGRWVQREGSEEGCQRSVTDSSAVLGVREGAFPPLCPHQTLSSQWAHLPILEL